MVRTTSSTTTTAFVRPDEMWRTVGLRAGQTVVHLGCGPGFYLIPAAIIVGATGTAIGVDILVHLLAEVESRARYAGVPRSVKTVRANLENPQGSMLPDSSADWVLVANILHQADHAKIFGEARRLVKDDGRVVIVEWDTVATPLGPPAALRVAKQEALTAAEGSGLVLERAFVPSPYHYGVILKPGVTT